MQDDAIERILRSRPERAVTSEHPELEELFDYHLREKLSGPRRDEIQAHLVECAVCRRRVLDLANFPALDPPSEDDVLDEDEERHEWQRLQAAIAAERVEPASPPAREPVVSVLEPVLPAREPVLPWAARVRAGLRLWLAPSRLAPLTTAVLVGGVSVALWMREGAVGNIQVEDVPRTQARQKALGVEPREPIKLGARARRLVLLLQTGDDAIFGEPGGRPSTTSVAYRIQLRRERDGKVLADEREIYSDQAGNLSLELDARRVEAGAYRVWLARGAGALEPAHAFVIARE